MKEQVIWTAAALVLCAALPAKAGAGANRVTGIEVDGPRLVIHGTQKPEFSAFKLAQPARLVVDLAGADVTGATAPAAVHKDGIAGVTVAQFDEGTTKVGRIVVAPVEIPVGIITALIGGPFFLGLLVQQGRPRWKRVGGECQ